MGKGPAGIGRLGDLLGNGIRDVLQTAYPDAIRRQSRPPTGRVGQNAAGELIGTWTGSLVGDIYMVSGDLDPGNDQTGEWNLGAKVTITGTGLTVVGGVLDLSAAGWPGEREVNIDTLADFAAQAGASGPTPASGLGAITATFSAPGGIITSDLTITLNARATRTGA